jgi:two-component sensor histidine kinase
LLRASEARSQAAAVTLEHRVAERTADLRAANEHLRRVVGERTDALAERDLLLREVYHRVKNNLQVVDSLVVLQADRLDDPQAREGLLDLRGRIYALGLVHHQLMGSANLKTFDIAPFLQDLSANLLQGIGESGVDLSVDASALEVDLDLAIPLGLLATELVTNALKHAFPSGSGRITVTLRSGDAGEVVLIVEDDGPGDSDVGPGSPRGIGLDIIEGLVAQLDGTMVVRSGPGRMTEIRTGRRTS